MARHPDLLATTQQQREQQHKRQQHSIQNCQQRLLAMSIGVMALRAVL